MSRPRVTVPDLAADLPFLVTRTFYNYLAFLERRMAKSGLDAHLRPGMAPVLYALAAQDDVLIKDIAERIQLALSTLSGVLVAMEQAGLVSRRADRADGRAARIRLTSRGRALLPRLYAFHQTLLADLHRPFKPRDIQTLRALLGRLNAAMKIDGDDVPVTPGGHRSGRPAR